MSWAEIYKAINSDLATEPLNTKTDRINTNVGSNADSASASGSVHAKLKDLKEASVADNINFATFTSISTANTWNTVLNITSGGCILHSVSSTNVEGNEEQSIRITIDGTSTTLNGSTQTYMSAFNQDSFGDSLKLIARLKAYTSLKVEVNNSGGTSTRLDAVVEYST